MTISGGVSLGAFEAGQLFFLTEALRSSQDAARLLIATGASAGSANSWIAATEACRTTTLEPEDSLGYRVWIPVGLQELFEPNRVLAHSIFVQDSLHRGFSIIEDTWSRGLPASCEFVVGVAVTREQGLDVELTEGLLVPRQAEHFSVHVQGRGALAPIFRNYIDPKQSFERPLLPLSRGADFTGARDFTAIREATLASMAFPIAFPPQSISHCVTPRRSRHEESADFPRCDTPTRRDDFIDGGVFDNNPLGLALRIARGGLHRKGGTPGFHPLPNQPETPKPEILHGYIDPDLTRYPLYEPPEDGRGAQDPLLSILARLGGQMLSSARGQELAALAEIEPRALGQLWLIETSYPPISGLLGAFFGFFERDFRDFDFFLGQYDTFYELRRRASATLGTQGFIASLESSLRGPAVDVPVRYRKLACLLGHFEPDEYGHLSALCAGEPLRAFRILLQVTLDRLWSNCRQVHLNDSARKRHAQCTSAHDGAPSPVVDPEFSVSGSRYQTTHESDFDYSMRLFADYHFHFKDLGLGPDESDEARLAIRRKLAHMVHLLADAQPDLADRTLLLTGGRAVVNEIEYEPPKHRFYALVGSYLAAGSLHRIGDFRAFYFNPDLRLSNFRTLFTDRTDRFAATLSAGLEWTLLPLSNNIFQTSVGVRAGYQMTPNDSIGFDDCTTDAVSRDPRECSQLVLHAPLNLTLLERIRVNLTPLFYPISQGFDHRVFDLEFGLGAEFF